MVWRLLRLQKRLEALALEIEEVEKPFRRTPVYQEAVRVRQELEQEYLKVDKGVSAGNVERDRLQNRLMDAEATEQSLRGPPQSDDEILWATLITISSMVILVLGRYQLIQLLSTVLVAGFTFVTIANLIHLQTLPEWRVGWDDLVHGLSFQFPSTKTGNDYCG